MTPKLNKARHRGGRDYIRGNRREPTPEGVKKLQLREEKKGVHISAGGEKEPQWNCKNHRPLKDRGLNVYRKGNPKSENHAHQGKQLKGKKGLEQNARVSKIKFSCIGRRKGKKRGHRKGSSVHCVSRQKRTCHQGHKILDKGPR